MSCSWIFAVRSNCETGLRHKNLHLSFTIFSIFSSYMSLMRMTVAPLHTCPWWGWPWLPFVHVLNEDDRGSPLFWVWWWQLSLWFNVTLSMPCPVLDPKKVTCQTSMQSDRDGLDFTPTSDSSFLREWVEGGASRSNSLNSINTSGSDNLGWMRNVRPSLGLVGSRRAPTGNNYNELVCVCVCPLALCQ